MTALRLIALLEALPDKTIQVYVSGKNQELYETKRVSEISTKDTTNPMDTHDKLIKSYGCKRNEVSAIIIEYRTKMLKYLKDPATLTGTALGAIIGIMLNDNIPAGIVAFITINLLIAFIRTKLGN